EAVIWTSTMSSNLSKPMTSSSALAANMIKSASAAGFVIGADSHVNANGTNYYWTAFSGGAGAMRVGTYAGTGSAQAISGIGFQPDLVFVIGAGSTPAVFRSSAIGGSVDFATGTTDSTRITS